MNEYKEKSTGLAPEVSEVIHEMQAKIEETLQDEFIGFYITGSLATGGFTPGVSDIDFMVITKGVLTDDLVGKLATMHKNFQTKLPKGFSEIEGSYLPQTLVAKYNGDNEIYPHLGTDGHFAVEKHDSDWIMQRYILRKSGIVVKGPELTTLIEPVSPEELKKATKGILEEWWKPQITDTHRLVTAEYQSYAVLTMCRALYTLKNGDIASKNYAAEWAKTNGLQNFSKLIDQSLEYRNGKDFNDLGGTVEIIRYVIESCEDL